MGSPDRPRDAEPIAFVVADALVPGMREDGRVVNVHALWSPGSTTRVTERS
jgi:hypothetical protein